MFIYAHRGASHDHPENTLAAFTGAAAQGADGVELDVRRAADGILVVHHDPHLDDGRIISSTPSAELPESVPTLAAAMELTRGLMVNVEVKNSPKEPGFEEDRLISLDAVRLCIELGRGPEILVSSFDAACVDAVVGHMPGIRTGLLVMSVHHPIPAIDHCLAQGHSAVHPWDPMIDESVVVAVHAAGLELNVWTVDDPDRIAELAAWGVDGVVTNRPGFVRDALR